MGDVVGECIGGLLLCCCQEICNECCNDCCDGKTHVVSSTGGGTEEWQFLSQPGKPNSHVKTLLLIFVKLRKGVSIDIIEESFHEEDSIQYILYTIKVRTFGLLI